MIILSTVPPVSRDALTHHLALPKLYIKNGGYYETPYLSFSYYPMVITFLYTIPLYFGFDIAAKYIHFGFALLTALMIYGYLKKRIDRIYALIGVILFLSTPIILKLSITAYVDLGLIFFSAASLLYLLYWAENRFRWKYLFVSAIFCGFALSAKYNGLITLFLLVVFTPLIYSRQSESKTASSKVFNMCIFGIVFLATALLVFSPWMIKNYMQTRNPIYPLYNKVFNPDDASASTSALKHFTLRKFVYHEAWWETMTTPVRIFFIGEDNNPKYFDGKLNPFLLLLPICALAGFRRDTPTIRNEKIFLMLFAVLYLLFAYFQTDMRIRYISPIIPPLAILSGFGLKEVYHRVNTRIPQKGSAIVICFVVLIMLFFNFNYIREQFRYVGPFDYIRGKISRDDYITRFRSEYPAIKYANDHIPPGSKILSLFMGERGYYVDREIRFDKNILFDALKESESADEVFRRLSEQGFTHLIIRPDLFKKWAANNIDPQTASILNTFFAQNTQLLFFEKGYGLYVLQGNPTPNTE